MSAMGDSALAPSTGLPLAGASSAADTFLESATITWCFAAPADGFVLQALALAIRWPGSPPTSNCSVVAAVRAACGIGGAPDLGSAPLGSSSARVVSAGPGGSPVFVGSDGVAATDPATGYPSMALPPVPLVGSGAYCVTLGATCDLALAQVARSRTFASPLGGFVAGPWLVRSSGAWAVLNARAAPRWGSSASVLRVSGPGGGPTPPHVAPPPAPSWPGAPSPSSMPSGSQAPMTVLAPMGAPALGGLNGTEDVPNVLVGGIDGLVACFVFVDAASAVRPLRLRFVPLAARADDAALLGPPAGCGAGGCCPAATSSLSLQLTSVRVRQRGASLDSLYYNITSTRFRTLQLPLSDADASVVSVDASFPGEPPMRGSEGWCVAVGPAVGYTMRMAHSTTPAGHWGPAACPNRLFSCYGVVDYRGSPPIRLERIGNAPWLALDLVVALPDPTPGSGDGGLSPGGVAAVVIIVALLASTLMLAWVRRWRWKGTRQHRVLAVALPEEHEEQALRKTSSCSATSSASV